MPRDAAAATAAPAEPTHRPAVALVYMPFGMPGSPSIQLGLLAEIARGAGYRADCYHLNLELAGRLPDDLFDGLWTYDSFTDFGDHMTGEWLFGIAAFGDQAPEDDAAYYAALPRVTGRHADPERAAAALSRMRHELMPRYVDDCLEMVPWDDYDVVGFSSMFQQNVASLALARRVKQRWPRIKIVFGGANMAGDMGPAYGRAFDFIDYVVVGEGDRVFPDLLTALAQGDESPDLRGLVSRHGNAVIERGMAPPVQRLDRLPTPDFDDYFERVRRLGLPVAHNALPFETSRGCWWGQKQHCTFCGLNAAGMAFRKKSVERVLDELAELSGRYGVTAFQITDNILEMRYIDTLFREIEEQRYDYQFFYEIKSNLRKDQLRQLAAGGIRWLQPGIETMNSHVLRLMRKGCTMLHNARTLKWSLYYKIRMQWNLIWGFPGETEEDYADELRVLKLLLHFEPPFFTRRIRMDRFAPIYEDRETFPARSVTPEKSYAFVYPPHVELDKAAYYFDYELEDTTADEVHREKARLIADWRQRFFDPRRRPRLTFRRTRDHLFIDDSRSEELAGSHTLSGPPAVAYEVCSDTMRNPQQIADQVNRRLADPTALTLAGAEEVLGELCEKGLMLFEAGKYLSLALPANPNL